MQPGEETPKAVPELSLWQKIRNLFLLKIKFAGAGAIATAVDYILYLVLVNRFLPPVTANIVSYGTAVLINFTMHRRFIFQQKGATWTTFLASFTASMVGLSLSTGLIYGLNRWPFFAQHQYLTKMLSTGILFFYNFYTKRFVFERRFI